MGRKSNNGPEAGSGFTVPEVARRLRVGQDKVRTLIKRGELRALNLGTRDRPRFVVLPADLDRFTATRAVLAPPPARRRPRRPADGVDFYPD